jgi:hypothetical protein
VIAGERHDFTEAQFDAPIAYEDIASNREEAFADTNQAQYSHLKMAVRNALGSA